MKILVCTIVLVALLSGCRAEETFETVADVPNEPVLAPLGQICLQLPDHAGTPVINKEDGGKLYLCDGYVLTCQTLEGGDLEATVRDLSGFQAEDLTIWTTRSDQLRRHEWVWSAIGEEGDQLCRAVVLDDGSYHYCLTAMAKADAAGKLEEEWDQIFDSFSLDQ